MIQTTTPDPGQPDFDEPALAAAVEAMPPEAVDKLPFGAVRLDASGRVLFFSRTEGQLSGYGGRPALGRYFFAEIAPCMSRDEFRGRIEAALASGHLDVEFGWIGDFNNAQKQLRVRAQSSAHGEYWIFIKRGG